MKICIATGTRAEYGLLKPLIKQVKNEPSFELQLLVTGTHLSPEFGLTYKQIETDGYEITAKIEMLLSSDTPVGITKSMGLGLISFADYFKELCPDIIVILGDRYEMLALASASLIFRIPIAHIHGGEITEGAYDDAIRHAITKMSSLHFTSTEVYRKRVIQLGEQPNRVFNVGAIGLDNFRMFDFLSKKDLEKELNITFNKFNYLVCFHPETLSCTTAGEQIKELLNAIDEQDNSFFIFTQSNADIDGRTITQTIKDYVALNPMKSAYYPTLGSLKFLSLMKIVTAVVGNSSSGIIEAPTALTATINIGKRQKGRIQADSIVNTTLNKNNILHKFELVKMEAFRDRVSKVVNPYGNGNTSKQITEILLSIKLELLCNKTFFNI